MAVKLSVAVRNGQLDAIESVIGAAPVLEIRSGAAPANCAAADAGTLLASMTLPADWMAAAANGSKAKSGTWQDPSVDADGEAGHFRIKVGGVCHLQGEVTATAGAGPLKLSSTTLSVGQQVTISAFVLNAGNA